MPSTQQSLRNINATGARPTSFLFLPAGLAFLFVMSAAEAVLLGY
jgi:hypothetical protein